MIYNNKGIIMKFLINKNKEFMAVENDNVIFTAPLVQDAALGAISEGNVTANRLNCYTTMLRTIRNSPSSNINNTLLNTLIDFGPTNFIKLF